MTARKKPVRPKGRDYGEKKITKGERAFLGALYGENAPNRPKRLFDETPSERGPTFFDELESMMEQTDDWRSFPDGPKK